MFCLSWLQSCSLFVDHRMGLIADFIFLPWARSAWTTYSFGRNLFNSSLVLDAIRFVQYSVYLQYFFTCLSFRFILLKFRCFELIFLPHNKGPSVLNFRWISAFLLFYFEYIKFSNYDFDCIFNSVYMLNYVH